MTPTKRNFLESEIRKKKTTFLELLLPLNIHNCPDHVTCLRDDQNKTSILQNCLTSINSLIVTDCHPIFKTPTHIQNLTIWCLSYVVLT